MNQGSLQTLNNSFPQSFVDLLNNVHETRGRDEYIKAMSVAIHNSFMIDIMMAVKIGYLGNHWLDDSHDVKVLETRKSGNGSAFDLILLDEGIRACLNIEIKTRVADGKSYNDIMRSVEGDILKPVNKLGQSHKSKLQALMEHGFDSASSSAQCIGGLVVVLIYDRELREELPYMNFGDCECIVIGGSMHDERPWSIKVDFDEFKNKLLESRVLVDFSVEIKNSGMWLGEYREGMDFDQIIEKGAEIHNIQHECELLKLELMQTKKELRIYKARWFSSNALTCLVDLLDCTINMPTATVATMMDHHDRLFSEMCVADFSQMIYEEVKAGLKKVCGKLTSSGFLDFINSEYDSPITIDKVATDLHSHGFSTTKLTPAAVLNKLLHLYYLNKCKIKLDRSEMIIKISFKTNESSIKASTYMSTRQSEDMSNKDLSGMEIEILKG